MRDHNKVPGQTCSSLFSYYHNKGQSEKRFFQIKPEFHISKRILANLV